MASTMQQLLGTAPAASPRQLSRARPPTNVLQTAAPAPRGSAAGVAPRRRSLAAALPRRRAAAMELEECLSEAEDWVFSTACEGAACWQPDGKEAVPATIGARVEMPPGLGNVNGTVNTVAHTNGNGNGKLASSANSNGAVHKPQGEGPMDQDALDAWRATMDIAQGDGGAGLPGDEQLRSRESLLLSVDGMVGNWELYGGISIASGSFSDEEEWAAVAPAAALPVDVAASGEYAALLAELQQLAESTGLAGRLAKATDAAARAAAAASGALGGEGASVIDIE